MMVEYAKRAIADLLSIAAYYEEAGVPGVGQRIAERVEEIVARIAAWPESGRLVVEERGLRVIPLTQYPYLVFYEPTSSGAIQILHIRHVARRSWRGDR